MGWSPDPELRQMFMDELNERSSRLVEGARAMRNGPVDSEYAGGMMREGHTIKGTARVLGFEAVSVGGLLVEEIWKRIQHGDLEPTEELALALEALAETVVGAGEADPDTGTVEHYQAMTRLSALVPDVALPAVTPPDPTAVAATTPLEPLVSVDLITDPTVVEPTTMAPAVAEPIVAAPIVEEEPVATSASPQEIAAAPEEPAVESAPPPQPEAASPPGGGVDPRPPLGRSPSGEYPVGAMSAVRRLRGQEDHGAEAPVPVPVEPAAPIPVAAVAVATSHEAPAASEPVAMPDPTPPLVAAASEPGRPASRSSDVDYLIESIGRWVVEPSMVNAGSLNRLVNGLSETRSQADILVNLVGQLGDSVPADIADHLNRVSTWLQQSAAGMLDESLGLAAVPVTNITNTLPQLVRLLSGKLGKDVAFEITGDESISVDRQILEQLSEPVRHVIVNALIHGIESPQARAAARKPEEASLEMRVGLRDGTFEIEIADDGAGVDLAAVRRVAVERGLIDEAAVSDESLERLVFLDGLSTGSEAESTGSGHGLSVVAQTVEGLFGRVRMVSEPAVGTTVTLAVPSARALEKLLLVEAGGGLWAVPSAAVEAVHPIKDVTVFEDGDAREIEWNASRIPLRSLAVTAGVAPGRRDQTLLVMSHRTGRAAFTCGGARGTYELWVRHLGASHAAPRHVFGMSFLANREAVLVLDAGRMVERASSLPDDDRHREVRVLVVDDSRGARAVVSSALASAGLTPSVAGSVSEALEVLDEHEVDALVVDFSMPNADGVALVKEVRARKDPMPIVMLSAVANEEDQTRAKRAGVDAFFAKGSFQEGVLADALWEMLDA